MIYYLSEMMMKNVNLLILQLVDDIQKKPKMFLKKSDYLNLSLFINGYLYALDNLFEINYNNDFSDWLNEQNRKTSLFWSDYIFLILAEEDDGRAYGLLLDKLIEFIKQKVVK